MNRLCPVLLRPRQKKNADKAGEIDQLIREAADAAGETSSAVVNLEKFHGATPTDAAVVTTLERARRISMQADAEVERLKKLRADCLTGNLETLPRLNIHTAPVISNSAYSPRVGEKLDTLAIQSLFSGLLTALLLPYLMELVFPPRQEAGFISDPIESL